MKPLILFFLKYLLAPLLAMLLLFITSALKSVRQKLSRKKLSYSHCLPAFSWDYLPF